MIFLWEEQYRAKNIKPSTLLLNKIIFIEAHCSITTINWEELVPGVTQGSYKNDDQIGTQQLVFKGDSWMPDKTTTIGQVCIVILRQASLE